MCLELQRDDAPPPNFSADYRKRLRRDRRRAVYAYETLYAKCTGSDLPAIEPELSNVSG
jgi:hypothetical protein